MKLNVNGRLHNVDVEVASFRLGPAAGKAEISTRVQLAGTQEVTVLAELIGRRFRRQQTGCW